MTDWDLSKFSNAALIQIANAMSEDIDRPIYPAFEDITSFRDLNLSMWGQFERVCDILRGRGVAVENEIKCPEKEGV